MITVQKSWETVYFTADKSGYAVKIELNLDRETGKYQICQACQEGIRFDQDYCIELSELRVKAIQAAIKYIKEQL